MRRLFVLAVLSIAAEGSIVPRVCDANGLAQYPPVCWQGTKCLPHVFGGPSTLDQCEFGVNKPSAGIFAGSCWTGSLFGFSGIDGPTSVQSQFVGWFVNGSYSVFLWLPTHRLLSLGFGDEVGADSLQDNVLVATNDVYVACMFACAACSLRACCMHVACVLHVGARMCMLRTSCGDIACSVACMARAPHASCTYVAGVPCTLHAAGC